MTMLLGVIAMTCAWALTGGNGQGYDPTNPPDPSAAYRLTVAASPARGGEVSPSGSDLYSVGQQVRLYARSYVGYDFRCWMEGEEVVSTDPEFYYEIPERNVTLTAWFDRNDHYDPANPGDPWEDGYYHRVNVYCTPSSGGQVNNSNFMLREGDETTISAYPNGNYKFSCWKQDGKIISVDPQLTIKMGTQNLSYTAQFVYNPASPGDPGTNNWNAALGDLVVDDFQPGNLWSTITRLVGDDDLDAVNTITVIGPMDSYDLSSVRNLSALTEADFSRTSGADRVPDWAFQDCQALTTVKLPASISSIDYYAFYGCQNLSELTCMAAMPPALGYAAFEGVPTTMVVKVYSSSLDIYMNTDIWRDYKIMTLDEETTALSVNLPEADDDRYLNAALQLSNLSTGQTQKLIVTPGRTRYIFGNLIPDTKYSLFVMAPGGQVIGSEQDFEMPADGKDITFAADAIKPLQRVSLTLTGSDGRDLSAAAQINWFDEKHSFLGSGATLPGQVAGYQLSYEIIPDREMAIAYATPQGASLTVSDDASANALEVKVEALGRATLSGVITDSATGEPVAGAFVTLTQEVNGQSLATTATTATTGADGAYALSSVQGEGVVTAGSPEHIEESLQLKQLAAGTDLAIKPIYGAEILLNLRAAGNVAPGAQPEFAEYKNYADLSFNIINATTGRRIENYRLRYPYLRLLDEVGEGESLHVIAIPANTAYNAAAGSTIVKDQKGEVTLDFITNGDLSVSHATTEADATVALLYDEKGVLMKRAAFSDDATALFSNLPAGKYSIVAMMESRLFSGAGTLAELAASRLQEGRDYLLVDAEVLNGIVSRISLDAVPAFDESMFYYTGPDTSVSLNKTSVTVGQTVTLRSKVDFMPEYASRIEKVNIIYTLPEGVNYVENSLLVPGNGANFVTIDRTGRLSVEVPLADASPRFCFIPAASGDHRISASIEFELDGEMIVQPIGSALISATDFSISAPDYTYLPRVTVRGGATPLSDVKVYDNDVLVGKARTLTNGQWRLTFDLFNPGEGSEHRIYAEITDMAGVRYLTSAARTIYDPAWAQLTDIEMIYGTSTVDFNHVDALTLPASYTYWPGQDMFTFKARFRDGAAATIGSLDFVILLSDGSVKRMDSKYLESQDAWVCAAGFPDLDRLPVNVKALYVTAADAEAGLTAAELDAQLGQVFRCPDAVPVIDPSGYVYEAVPSHRLEGVMATIFYKEWAEDMYGDVYEKVMRWDAEAYAQQNPLFTDADGMYQWDVPSGEWQVRFEKEGYDVATTEWLPVPPPQLDVNMGLVQQTRPEVLEVRAYEQAVEIDFDKYMQPEHFNDATIAVTAGGVAVSGTISLIDAEEAPDGNTYCRGVRFDADEPFATDDVTVVVGNQATSYAGIRLESPFTQDFAVEPEISEISAPESVEAYVGDTFTLAVSIQPGAAAEGKRVIATISTPIAELQGEGVADADGNAELSFTGTLPGQANVAVSVEGSKAAAANTLVSLTIKPDPCEAPVANIEDGSVITDMTQIELSCPTEGAEIWYTIDGTDPAESDTAILYDGQPLSFLKDVSIRMIARADGYLDSPEALYTYKMDESVGVGLIEAADGVSILPDGSALIIGRDAKVSICDASGLMLYGPVQVSAGQRVDLTALPAGIHILSIEGAPARRFVRR